MADPGLVAQGAMAIVTAALYASVAAAVLRRPCEPGSRHAMRMFALWWGGLAALEALDAARALAPAAGPSLLYLRAPPLALALWGLLHYLAFLYTGRRAWLLPSGLAAGVLGGALLALDLSGRAGTLVDILTLAPVAAAALAYGRLYRRAGAREQRYRIALVSAALLLWLVAAPLAGSAAAAALRLAAPLAALAAYRPPAPLRRWLDFGLPAESH